MKETCCIKIELSKIFKINFDIVYMCFFINTLNNKLWQRDFSYHSFQLVTSVTISAHLQQPQYKNTCGFHRCQNTGTPKPLWFVSHIHN